MARGALLIGWVSLTALAALPAQAKTPAQENPPAKTAKVKKIKPHRVARPDAQIAGTQAGDPVANIASAGNVTRAVPVAARHSSFFATPLGLLTLAGGAGGAASAAALSTQGSPSSPN